MTPRGRVLVVDDNPDIVALLRDLLKLEGYQVHAAVGDLVLPLARAVRADLILLDAHMPGLDGAALSRRLRADPCLGYCAHPRRWASALRGRAQ